MKPAHTAFAIPPFCSRIIVSHATTVKVSRMAERLLSLESFLPYQINVLASRLSRQLARVYGERFGISIAEWRVIAHLASEDKISVREIVQRVDMDKSKVSRAATNLEANGIIEKKVDPADRRLIEMQLTRKGKRLFAQIEPLALEFQNAVLEALSERERKQFRKSIDNLLSRLENGVDGLRDA